MFKQTRVNESLSETATKLLYRLNKIPIVTFGSNRHLKARKKLRKILHATFPYTDKNCLDRSKIAWAISPQCHEQVEYLAENFDVEFDSLSPGFDLDLVDNYLSDLSTAEILDFEHLLNDLGLSERKPMSIDAMLSALYEHLLDT